MASVRPTVSGPIVTPEPCSSGFIRRRNGRCGRSSCGIVCTDFRKRGTLISLFIHSVLCAGSISSCVVSSVGKLRGGHSAYMGRHDTVFGYLLNILSTKGSFVTVTRLRFLDPALGFSNCPVGT